MAGHMVYGDAGRDLLVTVMEHDPVAVPQLKRARFVLGRLQGSKAGGQQDAGWQTGASKPSHAGQSGYILSRVKASKASTHSTS